MNQTARKNIWFTKNSSRETELSADKKSLQEDKGNVYSYILNDAK